MPRPDVRAVITQRRLNRLPPNHTLLPTALEWMIAIKGIGSVVLSAGSEFAGISSALYCFV